MRRRRPRLSWFRFYPDDWWGGIRSLSVPDTGAYLLLILDQWGSGDRQLIDAEPERLRLMLRGLDPSPAVLEKFEEIDIDGRKFLRNKRIAQEWEESKREYEGKKKGGGKRSDTGAVSAPDTAPHTVPKPEPEPESISTYLPTARARAETPRLDRMPTADAQTEQEIRKLQNTLGSLLARLAEHKNSRLMVPAWCRRVTRYGKGDGAREGAADYRTIRSIGRLEKSIADAKWWLEKLDGGRVVSGQG